MLAPNSPNCSAILLPSRLSIPSQNINPTAPTSQPRVLHLPLCRLFQLFPSHPLPLVFLLECVIAMTILRMSPLPSAFAQTAVPDTPSRYVSATHRVRYADPSVVVLAHTCPCTAFIQHGRNESSPSPSLCVPNATTFLTRPPPRTPRSVPIPLPFSNTQPKLVHIFR